MIYHLAPEERYQFVPCAGYICEEVINSLRVQQAGLVALYHGIQQVLQQEIVVF